MKQLKFLLIALLIPFLGNAQTGPTVRVKWKQLQTGTAGQVAIVGTDLDGHWVTPPFLSYADTALMLATYQTQINARVKYTDTAAMLAGLWSAIATKANDNAVVHLSGNETVNGTKTFNASPIIPNGSVAGAAVNKSQLDALSSSVGSTYIPLSQKAAANGVATLDGNLKIPAAQLPSIAITDVFTPSSLSAMLALTAETGDVAVRTDVDSAYILKASPASTYSNWVWLKSPKLINTDQLPEGLINKYFTEARARNSVSATGSLSYNPTTGVFSYTTPSGLPPTGSAGGDLSGSYPAPTVAKFNNQLPSYYLARANQTGTQTASTISDFASAARALLSGAGTVTYNSATGQFTGAATNLGITGTTGDRVITSSTGTGVTVPIVSGSASGLVSPTQKAAWDAAAGYTPPTPSPELFTATTSSTLTLAYTPTAAAYVFVSLNGQVLSSIDWTITGTTLTLSFNPETSDRIEVYYSHL